MILAQPFKAGITHQPEIFVAFATIEEPTIQPSLTRRNIDSLQIPALKRRAKLIATLRVVWSMTSITVPQARLV
jgi:hypothetical protein